MKLQIQKQSLFFHYGRRPPLSFSLLTQMTQTQFTPFIINLDKTTDGYAFHSLEQQHQTHAKLKKSKPPQLKTTQNKITNRLIKEIGLISDLPPLIQEESQASKDYNQEEAVKQEFEAVPEEEEIDCEIKRNNPLPDCPSEWFEYLSIHPIEVDLFPEFHNGKSYKTPQLYQCLRNFIVDSYRKNPNRYLTFISCRRVLRGDASCLLKIYKFLEDQGIINYCLFNEGNYSFEVAAMDKTSQLTKRLQSYIKKMPEQASSKKDEEIDTDNLTVTVINKNFSRTFRVYCCKCKLICGIVWYSTQEENQRNLCYDCYNKSQPEIARQFTKVDILKKMEISKEGKQANKTSWGLEDNIKLLDFMGNCEGRSWSELMSLFEGKKALQDIIIQFMQFPITNYDPQAQASVIQHGEIDYTQQEHVDMLIRSYQNSVYSIKKEAKGQYLKEEEEEAGVPYQGSEAPHFREYSNLIIKKYIDKMESLRRIESILQQANLSINEQPLCKRMRISTNALRQYSDDLALEEE